MKKFMFKKLGFITPCLFLFIIVFVNIVQAADPHLSTTTSTYGIVIENPYITPIKLNNDHSFHFHIFNNNNSKPYLNTSGVVCIFHLYNITGYHMVKIEPVLSDDKYDFEAIVTKGNFTRQGTYAFLMQCNNSIEGGFYENSFEVEPFADYSTTATSDWRIFLILAISSMALLAFSLYMKNYIFSFITGILFAVAGIYCFIYGFDNITDLYTRIIALIYVGIGMILIIISSYSLMDKEFEGEVNEED